MANNRTKGHNYERELRKKFIEIGFDLTQTSRNASKQIDDIGIDLCYLPLNIQAKIGYAKNRPKYDVLYKGVKSNLAKLPKDHPIQQYPFVLFHKIDGRKLENHTMTVDADFGFFLLKLYEQHLKQI